jgi:hypothetical protein
MNRAYLLASAVFACGAAAPASAESLSVAGVVAPFCNVNLTNVSSGTASVAMVARQQIANLRLSCNAASGTKLITQVQNGDLLSSAGNRINYALDMVSPSDPAFDIASHDTNPIGGENNLIFTRSKAGYSAPIAVGIPLQLWMDVNVNVDAQALGSNNFPANAAPAGTYNEVFTFTASSV